MSGKISVIGIGPGSSGDITFAAQQALGVADVVVGYKYYFQFIKNWVKEGAELVDTGMKQELARARYAIDGACGGKHVAVISSGDADIYGMAPLIYEMIADDPNISFGSFQLETIPGISAFQKASSLLGAPISHDFCTISLSDLMTPWATIERRIRAAASGDFVTAVYNPRSNGRYWQLSRLRELFLSEGRSVSTPVGIVRQAGREEQTISVTTLGVLNPEMVDMFCILIIGNSQSFMKNGLIITPRGYKDKYGNEQEDGNKQGACNEQGREGKIGQNIMIESFRTIANEMHNPDIPLERKWPLLHAIHTTADFSMEEIFLCDEHAVPNIYNKVARGECRTIITDVTMVASGIRKGALQRMGVEVKCYLSDPRVAEMASTHNITRTQAGIRLAVEEHPDALFAFGNAPTALMELCDLMRKGKAHPTGIVAAPVGFVHVCESKHMVKVFTNVPKLIIDGRKGGSNLAATLCNAILCWPDAQELLPGRDV